MLLFKNIYYTLLIFNGIINFINASSSGDVYDCNVNSGNFGCSSWNIKNGKEDRLNCTDPNPGHMYWADRPVRTNAYVIRSSNDANEGNDPTQYVPDKYISIFLKVKDPKYKYRGLMLYAQDTNNQYVGEWALPETENYPFWHPPICSDVGGERKIILHNNAAEKMYTMQFNFKGPPVGTGKITFRTLIKQGPANEGAFYFPKEDLVLNEGQSSKTEEGSWKIGQFGQSCTDVCSNLNLVCKMDETGNQVSSRDKHIELFSHMYPCTFPLVGECGVGSPAVSAGDTKTPSRCYYRKLDNQCPAKTPVTTACLAKSNNMRRFCFCKSNGRRRLKEVLTTQKLMSDNDDENENGGTKTSNSKKHIGNMSNMFYSFGFTILCTIFLAENHNNNTKGIKTKLSFSLVVVFITFLFVTTLVPVHSHNWLRSNSRGKGFASTTKPCKPKARGDTTHYQIGPGQHFYVTYSTGHGGPARFYIVHEDYLSKLANNRFKHQIAREYLANQPVDDNGKQTHNNAQDDEFKRYHLCHSRHNCYGRGNDPTWYKKKYLKEDATTKGYDAGKYPVKNKDFGDIYEYHDDKIARDQRVQYKSDKYPGVEGIYEYRIVGHQPHDYDLIKITIPAYNGPGHYIVHFTWKGYMDCIDVDVFDHHVDNVHGLPVDPHWVKYDHCQFLNFRQVIGHIIDVTFSPKALEDEFDSHFGPAYVGINVVPMQLSGENSFPMDPAALPYRRARNWDSTLLQLETKTPKRTDKWSTLATSINFVEVEDKTCSLPATNNLFKYTYQCKDTPCSTEDYRNYLQISVTKAAMMPSALHNDGNFWGKTCRDHKTSDGNAIGKNIVTVDPVNNHIICCLNDDTESKTNWKRITWTFPNKPSRSSNYAQAPNLFMNGNLVKFSFQHQTHHAPKGYWVDVGRPFGPQKNLMTKVYGDKKGFGIIGYGKWEVGPGCGTFVITSEAECLAAANDHWNSLLAKNLLGLAKNLPNLQELDSDKKRVAMNAPAGCFQHRGWGAPRGIYYNPITSENKNNNCSFYAKCICKTPDDAFSNQELTYGWKDIEPDELNGKFVQYNHKGHGRPFPFWDLGGDENENNTGFNGLWVPEKRRTWEIEVPNGQYEVTLVGVRFHVGCVIEKTFLYGENTNANNGDRTLLKTVKNVLVRDGRLSFGNYFEKSCGSEIKGLYIKQVPLTMAPVPFPSMSNIIWEQEILEPNAPIGGVVIKRLGYPNYVWKSGRGGKYKSWQFTKSVPTPGSLQAYNTVRGAFWTCQQRWLFDSDYCFDSWAVGKFNDGFKVVLADAPCVDQGSCPPETHVCKHVVEPHFCKWGPQNTHCPIQIDCGGKIAKYVRIILPGNNRILVPNFNIQVYRAEPKIIDPNKMIGYAVEQAEPTKTRPPYVLSNDPEDPIFYSTCYIYKSGVQWLPTVKQEVKRDWSMNTQCLRCDNYEANEANNASTPRDGQTPKWITSNVCSDCNNVELCWKDCSYNLPEGIVIDGGGDNKPPSPPSAEPVYRKKIKHSFVLVGTSDKEVLANKDRIKKAIATSLGVKKENVVIIEVVKLESIYEDRRRRELLAHFMIGNSVVSRGRYLKAPRVKVVYEVLVLDDEEASAIQSKMKDGKSNLDYAENIEKQTGLTIVVESSGEEPVARAVVVEPIVEEEDQNNANPGMDVGTIVIIVTIVLSLCTCSIFFASYKYLKNRKKKETDGVFSNFRNAQIETSENTQDFKNIAVPLKLTSEEDKQKVIEMQEKINLTRQANKETPEPPSRSHFNRPASLSKDENNANETPVLPSRSHFNRPATLSKGGKHKEILSTAAVAGTVSKTEEKRERIRSSAKHRDKHAYYNTVHVKSDKERTSHSRSVATQRNRKVTMTAHTSSNVPAQYRKHIRHDVLDTVARVADLPVDYVPSIFGDGQLLHVRPFDNMEVIKLQWGILYRIKKEQKRVFL